MCRALYISIVERNPGGWGLRTSMGSPEIQGRGLLTIYLSFLSHVLLGSGGTMLWDSSFTCFIPVPRPVAGEILPQALLVSLPIASREPENLGWK